MFLKTFVLCEKFSELVNDHFLQIIGKYECTYNLILATTVYNVAAAVVRVVTNVLNVNVVTTEFNVVTTVIGPVYLNP